MRKRRAAFACGIVLFLAASGAAVGQKDDKAAALAFIQTARLLEEKPFHRDAKEARRLAITWLLGTDQVSLTICSLILSGIDQKYEYETEVVSQYTIGMGVFKLTNPDRVKDENAAQMAGILSALTSYEAMVREQPRARNAFMDSLLVRRSDGSLVKYVAENNCKKKV